MTTDRNSNRDFSVARIGRIKKSDIESKVGGKFDHTSTLVSDKHRSITSFAKSEGIKHVNFISAEHTAGGEYHIQNVNNLASRLKTIINHMFRDVSTKYLQSYTNWFAFKEEVKENIEGYQELSKRLSENKEAWNTYTNIEISYKKFIENLSVRTYRCPTKRKWKTASSSLVTNIIAFI